MALKKQALKRTFTVERNGGPVELADPNPSMSPDQVMVFYSNQYPELNTVTVSGPVVEGTRLKYSFRTTVGTKG